MQYHKMFEICKKAIKKHGIDNQCMMAVEELAELQTAICHFLRGREDNVPEEIADVEIMIMQLKIALNCSDEVEKQKDCKIKRLQEMIQEDEAKLKVLESSLTDISGDF